MIAPPEELKMVDTSKMDIKVLNTSFQVVALVDTVDSFRWTERYNSPGEFEIYTPVKREYLDIFQLDYYIQIPSSEYTMIIETREIRTNPETGNVFVVSGRSVESLLDRRIVWIQTTIFQLDPELALKRIIGDQVVDGTPLNSVRGMPEFTFVEGFDSYIKSLQMTAQYQTNEDDVLDITMDITKKFKIGFKVTFNSVTNKFQFMLYNGRDRSYNQSTYSYVVFSPAFDNLISSSYLESTRIFKTVSRVVGDETVGTNLYRVYVANPQDPLYGGYRPNLQKREAFTDASDISRLIEGTSTPIGDSEYQDKLTNRGQEDLVSNYPLIKQFDAQIDVSRSFKYRTDFFLGDIVQIENEYGIKGTARIIEMTFSQNLAGYDQYPTLDYL